MGIYNMNVSLTPELEHFVQEKVESGFYTSASEVIRESLRLMHTYDDIQKQRISQLNQAIEAGLNYSGEKIPAAESYMRLKNKIDSIAKKK
jgi:antitoxin ParD1/3/4